MEEKNNKISAGRKRRDRRGHGMWINLSDFRKVWISDSCRGGSGKGIL